MEERNHLRKRIINENLMEKINKVKMSDRNRKIVVKYVEGMSYKEIAEKYRVSSNRIEQIVCNYLIHAKKLKEHS